MSKATMRRPDARAMARLLAEQTQTGAGLILRPAWREGLTLLPEPYGILLLPLWQTLPAGTGMDLLHQVREDVYRAVGQARQESGERSKLVTALCLSSSLLVAVVLL